MSHKEVVRHTHSEAATKEAELRDNATAIIDETIALPEVDTTPLQELRTSIPRFAITP